MSALSRLLRVGIAMAACSCATGFGQNSGNPYSAADAPPIQLPAMMVSETASAPPWQYARVGPTEYLARCGSGTLPHYAEAWERALHAMNAVVPESLLRRTELPAISILYSQKLAETTSPELLRALRRSGGNDRAVGDFKDVYYSFAPNMRLNDRDVYVTFTYLDEANFDPTRLSVAPEYVRFLLQRRVPALPHWFITGMNQVFADWLCNSDRIILKRIVWIDVMQSRGLYRDAHYPRTFLPPSDLFAPDALRGERNGNGQRQEVFSAESALFVRWALTTSAETREALWRFAAACAEQTPSEALFESCFGFGYSDLRDRLSDYLPHAVKEDAELALAKPSVSRVSVRNATPAEIARLRGEWERLALVFVQDQQPELRDRYLERARTTLRPVVERGEHDPGLLATLGLCELDAGNGYVATDFLGPATIAGVARPRPYHELARLRLADLQRSQPGANVFPLHQLRPIIDLLRKAAALKPTIPETYKLLAETLARADAAPSAADLALLQSGVHAFAHDADVCFFAALVLARHGQRDVALTLLSEATPFASEADAQRLNRLREAVLRL